MDNTDQLRAALKKALGMLAASSIQGQYQRDGESAYYDKTLREIRMVLKN